MPSFVSWVDYSSAERRRMRQAVALFKESETRDELGLGNIRDALSDVLFPGTSTIETRLAYALMVPWIYRELEEDRSVRAGNVADRARKAEIGLIDVLRDNEDTRGLIGSRAGATLLRLPSSVYWATLNTWGIFRQRWSIDEYHRAWDSLGPRRPAMRTDDAGVAVSERRAWHPALPKATAEFPKAASFALRREDAEFLTARILESCKGSLLAHALLPGEKRPDLTVDLPWDAFLSRLPDDLRDKLAIARRFSWLMQGAAYAYNIALARMDVGREEWVTRAEEGLELWAASAAKESVETLDLDDLWLVCAGKAQISPATRTFVSDWQALLRNGSYAAVGKSRAASALVEAREATLKGEARSRFRDKRARDRWGGNSGTGLMTYRWRTTRTFLTDLARAGDT